MLVKNNTQTNHAVLFSGPPGTSGVNRTMQRMASYSVSEFQATKYLVKLVRAPHPWGGAWLRIFDHPYFAVD